MNNFDLRKYLIENRITNNSKLVSETSLLVENFYSIDDTQLKYPLTQYILQQIAGKLPGLEIKKNPELEASGAEGIVVSLDDYRVIKLFFSLRNAAKVIPLINKNLTFTANITSAGTIKLNAKVKYVKKGSTYSNKEFENVDTIYYVVMDRIIPDSKTYNDLELAYNKFSDLKEITNVDNLKRYLEFVKSNKYLSNYVKTRIFNQFLQDENITGTTSEELLQTTFLPTNFNKKQLNDLISRFFVWKKKQTKTKLFVYGENYEPLLLKWLFLTLLGKYTVEYDIKTVAKNFYSSLKGNLQDNFKEIFTLLKEIVITNKIDWKDIHREQFGRKGKENKLVAIDIGIKTDVDKQANLFSKNILNVDIKKQTRQSVSENLTGVEELNFFDFDSTLFLTPGKEEGSILYKKITGKEYPHQGWIGRPESLLPAYNIEINPKIVNYLNKATANPKAKNFLLTNRTYKLEAEVKKILQINNIKFNDYLFKVGDQTKSQRVEQALKQFPTVKKINIYDDRTSELVDIQTNFKEKYNLWRPELEINLVKIYPPQKNTIMDNFDLKKYLVENKITKNSKLITEQTDTISGKDGIVILISDFVKKHIIEHNKPGIGSVFRKGIAEKDIEGMVKQVASKVTGDGGPYQLNSPNVGYNLVLPIEKAEKLKGSKEGEVEKQEGPNTVKVRSVTTTEPLTNFTTDIITLIIRKSNPQYLPEDVKTNEEILKKIEEGKCYSLLTAFPGDPDIPKASEWNGKYAVIIPGSSSNEEKNNLESLVNEALKKFRKKNK